MGFLTDWLTDWLKELLIEGITGNLTGLFDTVNTRVGEIAVQVGTTPAAWNAGVFSLIRQLSETVILPIAGLILTFVATYELIQLIIEKNNLHELDYWIFFKWIFKTACAILILSNTFNIVMAVFDVSQSVIANTAGIVQGSTDISTSMIDTLEATFENGARVVGEAKIAAFKKAQDCRIRRVALLPGHPAALPATLEAIRAADLILLGPGSLYTSIIPNLLVDGVAEAVCAAAVPRVYISNIMTQDGETEGMTLSEHVAALLDHAGPGLIDVCLANCAPIRPELLERYREEGSEPIAVDRAALKALGVDVVERPLASEESPFARHSIDRLAQAVMELYEDRAHTKIF